MAPSRRGGWAIARQSLKFSLDASEDRSQQGWKVAAFGCRESGSRHASVFPPSNVLVEPVCYKGWVASFLFLAIQTAQTDRNILA